MLSSLLCLAALVAPVSSLAYAPMAVLRAPAASRAAVLQMQAKEPPASTYQDYAKEKESKTDGDSAESSGPPQPAFGASSSLIGDVDLMNAAREAAEAAGFTEKFSPSQIVIAFNAYKLSKGLVFKSKDEESKKLRDFALDFKLVETHLKAAESALFTIEGAANPYADDDLTDFLVGDWREKFSTAAMSRTAAEKQKAAAMAGQAAAEDKLRLSVTIAGQEEKQGVLDAQLAYKRELAAAEERAASERQRLALLLAEVAREEKEARQAADKKLASAMQATQMRSATTLASAQADRAGALHKWKQTAEQAERALAEAEKEMNEAMARAQEQEALARAAAEKKASLIVAAQSEAKALLELLKQSRSEAAAQALKLEAEKREMEEAVEIANKRARKAKLAAAAALEDL